MKSTFTFGLPSKKLLNGGILFDCAETSFFFQITPWLISLKKFRSNFSLEYSQYFYRILVRDLCLFRTFFGPYRFELWNLLKYCSNCIFLFFFFYYLWFLVFYLNTLFGTFLIYLWYWISSLKGIFLSKIVVYLFS